MSDDRLSIVELRAAHTRDTFTDEAKLIDAIPVLLEIAAAALRSRAGMMRSEVDTTRCEALDRALAKVRS